MAPLSPYEKGHSGDWMKVFYTFEQSAHSPLFEESEKGLHILQTDVLNGKASLADAK